MITFNVFGNVEPLELPKTEIKSISIFQDKKTNDFKVIKINGNNDVLKETKRLRETIQKLTNKGLKS